MSDTTITAILNSPDTHDHLLSLLHGLSNDIKGENNNDHNVDDSILDDYAVLIQQSIMYAFRYPIANSSSSPIHDFATYAANHY